MIKIIGMETGKIYAQGRKSECFRMLLEKYPSLEEHHLFAKKGVAAKSIYPEPLKVVRKWN